jgi:pyruvate/2-oxoglutarate dehydrogenase complex dihydrolipoamide acyltransferase (E2) component
MLPAMAKKTRIRGWRKITSATWGHPNDPQIYGDLEIDATTALEFIDAARTAGHKLTITHLAGKAVAHALGENPDLNVRMYRSNFVHRETVDIFFIVSTGAGSELSGVKVERADQKPVVEIARELASRASRIRDDEDVEFGKTKRILDRTPRSLLGASLRAAAWLTADRDIDMKKRGLPRQAFGSAMVSSVGMFGIQHAYAPLSPYYRIPFLILVGEVAMRPAVVDGAVVPRAMLTISATMDHRYLDGFHAARLAKSTRAYLADPQSFEPTLS